MTRKADMQGKSLVLAVFLVAQGEIAKTCPLMSLGRKPTTKRY
ncbi:MAG: hypothetical protein RLZZ505_611 [Verrucomicrobiota bacterium]|jgi:hypothetical protein